MKPASNKCFSTNKIKKRLESDWDDNQNSITFQEENHRIRSIKKLITIWEFHFNNGFKSIFLSKIKNFKF
ncbi:hypothetical protein CXF59_05110 [Flavobacterium sp. ALD4]|nr:hypothetical protein CXF59_05110 [Flavobacterium sp. ALD4]